MVFRIGTCLIWLFLSLAPAHAGNSWSSVRYPLDGPPRVIGSYVAGCIAGAVELPWVGEYYQVMRLGRHRHYGHPQLIHFVERLSQQAAAPGKRLLIGDLSQPRGGPTPSDHRSHQSGLDVDIWYLQQPRERVISADETDRMEMPSMVHLVEGRLKTQWSPRYRDALRLAALSPAVERIFVNAIIKRALCDSEKDRQWLNKIRPWWGHDAHFHVRLGCPPDSTDCQPQKPLPPGDGCDAELTGWVRNIMAAARAPKVIGKPAPPSEDRLPEACQGVLATLTAQR